MTRTLLWLWQWDPVLQGIGLCASAVGVALSAWLTREAWGDYAAVARNGCIERIVARSHLRAQVAVLTVQLGHALISVFVLFLPPISSTMAVYPGGALVLTVIVLRKLIRAALIFTLATAAVMQAHDRRRTLQLLREE